MASTYAGAVLRASNLGDEASPASSASLVLRIFEEALKDHGIGFAKRIAREHIFVISGAGKSVFSLALPIGRLRNNERADRSPSYDPTLVLSLQLLDGNLF